MAAASGRRAARRETRCPLCHDGQHIQRHEMERREAIIRLRPGLAVSRTRTRRTISRHELDDPRQRDAISAARSVALNIAVPHSPRQSGSSPSVRTECLSGRPWRSGRNRRRPGCYAVSNQAIRTAQPSTARVPARWWHSPIPAAPTVEQQRDDAQCGGERRFPDHRGWCTEFNGGGAPIITTTDGTSNAIVWVVEPKATTCCTVSMRRTGKWCSPERCRDERPASFPDHSGNGPPLLRGG